MSDLPTNRTVTNTAAEHVADHDELARLHNHLDTFAPLNVRVYGALGDNSHDDTAAIQAAIDAAQPGQTVYLPPGTYKITSPLVMEKYGRILRGAHSPDWRFGEGFGYPVNEPCVLKLASTFTGGAVIQIFDDTITGASQINGWGAVRDLSIDCFNATSSTYHGIWLQGLIENYSFENLDISFTTGAGFRAEAGATTRVGLNFPLGLRLRRVNIWKAGQPDVVNNYTTGDGFYLANTTDSTFESCLTTAAAGHGWNIVSNPADTAFMSCRAAFNQNAGFYIHGANNLIGGCQFVGCSTDRNGFSGFLITATSTNGQPIAIVGCRIGRDGSRADATFNAGIQVEGSLGNVVAPVMIYGVAQMAGVNDDGSGTASPKYGLRIGYTTNLLISSSQLAYTTAALLDNGNHSNHPRLDIIGTYGTTVTGSRGSNAALASLLTALAAQGIIVDGSS